MGPTDSAASGLRTPFGVAWISYDAPMLRWVPVNREMQSPDGKTWLYGTLRQGNEYHAVDIRNGKDTRLWGSDRFFRVIGLDNTYAYGMLDGPGGAHLWKLPLDGSQAVQLSVNGTWQFIDHGAAWGTGGSSLPPGAEAFTDVGKYIVVHERQDDDSTKIVFDIFNSNQEAS